MDVFKYGMNSTIMSNPQLMCSGEFYEGGRNAIKEYLLLYTKYILTFILQQLYLGKVNLMQMKETEKIIRIILN